MFEDFIISTTHQLEGYRIIKYIDVVFEENLFGMSFETSVQTFGEFFKGFSGERYDAISDRIEVIKEEVKRRIIRKSIRKGANALVGFDIETTTTDGGGITISMSGTAVIIEKI